MGTAGIPTSVLIVLQATFLDLSRQLGIMAKCKAEASCASSVYGGRAAVNSPTLQSHAPKRYTVIIAEAFRNLLDVVIRSLPYRQRVSVHTKHTLKSPQRFIIRRTFLHLVNLRLPDGITLSSTDAVRSSESSAHGRNRSYFTHRRGPNPRSFVQSSS